MVGADVVITGFLKGEGHATDYFLTAKSQYIEFFFFKKNIYIILFL